MTKSELKAGYLLEKEDGSLGVLMPLVCGGNETLAIVIDFKSGFCQQIFDYDPFERWNAVRVYGLPTGGKRVWEDISIEYRPLLWQREQPKKSITLELTDEQIESLKKQGII